MELILQFKNKAAVLDLPHLAQARLSIMDLGLNVKIGNANTNVYLS